MRELEPLTKNQIDVIKDVSIAFLSISGLLLTLILGFISPSFPKGSVDPKLVGAAATCFVLTAVCAACALGQLADAVTGSPVAPRQFRLFYYLQIACFLIGLFVLLFVIMSVIHPFT